MSRFNTYLKTAIEIIENYNGHEPFAHYLKLFFKKYRKAGSRDRKNISQLCYSYYRIGLAYCDKTVDEQIILGLFLCTTQYSELLNNLMPQWTSAVHLNILEKLHFLGLSQNPKLFPATSFLNEDLPVIPFEHSHLIKPLHFMRIRPGHTGLINKLTELPIIKINDSCIAWEESLNMEKYITSLKDLIAETFRNSFKLNESAKNGDPKACF